MQRITNEILELVVARINTTLGMPLKPYVDGKPQAGNFHIESAGSGQHSLRRMSLEPGCSGSSAELACGATSKRDLYEHMHTFLAGVEYGKKFQF